MNIKKNLKLLGLCAVASFVSQPFSNAEAINFNGENSKAPPKINVNSKGNDSNNTKKSTLKSFDEISLIDLPTFEEEQADQESYQDSPSDSNLSEEDTNQPQPTEKFEKSSDETLQKMNKADLISMIKMLKDECFRLERENAEISNDYTEISSAYDEILYHYDKAIEELETQSKSISVTEDEKAL